MKVFLSACVALLLCGCGVNEKDPKKPELSQKELLQHKYDLYNKLMHETQVDQWGFIETSRCDSLLLTSLANPDAQLNRAEVESGRWLRRPVDYQECFEAGESRSSISRDGLLGVMYRSMVNKDLATLKRLWDYGNDHNWIMGEDGQQHAVFSPDYIALLAQCLYMLSNGKYDYAARSFIYPTLSPGDGYVVQLQDLFTMVRQLAYGHIDTTIVSLRNQLADKNPRNPLAQMTAGRYDVATEILLNDWPKDRLPTSVDWCTEWKLSQAPAGNGLKPCTDENETHSGGDLLFVAGVILGI